MKLIALILGLALEHVATRGLRLRELRWFDPYFDFALTQARRVPRVAAVVVVVFCIAVAVLPVLWASISLKETFIPWDLPYLVFAVFIVFLCLGPRDLVSEVDDYCAALQRGDHEEGRRVLTELSESRQASTRNIELAEEAVFVQATNRIFGVVFWFVVLGPVGAWLFRLSDLLRRRAAFEAARHAGAARVATAAAAQRVMEEQAAAVAAGASPSVPARPVDTVDSALPAAEWVHAVLAFIPARLAALGFALSGSFDDAFDGWRRHSSAEDEPLQYGNQRIVAAVGKAAMTGVLEQPANSSAAARNAMRLVMRTLFIWITVIALMTIFGWAV